MADGEITVSIDDDDDDAESSARIEAANRRSEASRAETARLRAETVRHRAEGARHQVDTALSTALTEISAAQASYSDAFERGDFATAGEATARIAAAESRKVLLENQRQALARMPMSTGDPVEDYCAGRTDPTATWLRAHPDWVTDSRKNAKLVGAHHSALGEGLEPDTSDYFEFVEKQIGLRGGGNGRSGSSRASVGYDPADHRTHVNSGSVYLTPNERKMATDGTLVHNSGPLRGKPLGLQEMARRKAEMAKQGMYHRLG
jgi:hypothetical protein